MNSLFSATKSAGYMRPGNERLARGPGADWRLLGNGKHEISEGKEMAEHIKLPPVARRGAQMKIRKGWRLVTPDRRRAFKAALVGKFNSMRGRFAIFRIE